MTLPNWFEPILCLIGTLIYNLKTYFKENNWRERDAAQARQNKYLDFFWNPNQKRERFNMIVWSTAFIAVVGPPNIFSTVVGKTIVSALYKSRTKAFENWI